MKISYNWLKEYLDVDLTPEALAEKITDAGLEVEEIIHTVQEVSNIVVGKVRTCTRHPDADKLSICTVYDGEQEQQVICGAPNVAAGQTIPFARVGARLPNGMKIKKAKIRGTQSFGMICSREELALEEHSDGIWELSDKWPAGTDMNEVLKEKSDVVFDLFITANRADCFSHIGIAREIAAFTAREVRMPHFELKESNDTDIHNMVKVSIEYSQGCPRYAARLIRNVTIQPSPDWLVQRLEAVGLRSINNVVDVTNFVLYELGQPLHAFDYETLSGGEIRVRASQKDEKFITLDDKERLLPENTVMICDAEKAVAIGGIMGGQNSEVTDHTTSVLLESAYFDPTHVITSSRKLGLMTDASQRFEKGTDYNMVPFALDRAAALIAELSGGEVAQGVIDVYPTPITDKQVPLPLPKVNKILGATLSDEEIIDLLSRVHLNYANGLVSVPSYRHDINEPVDLIEEVARLKNYDNLPTSVFEPLSLEQPERIRETSFTRLRTLLTQCGLQEIFTNSMMAEKHLISTGPAEHVRILNPISDDLACMRTSILSGLLLSMAYNINRNQRDLRFFEIGRVFFKGSEEIPEQPTRIGLALTGNRYPESWSHAGDRVDFYDLKGVLESFFNGLHLDNVQFVLYDDNTLYKKGYAAQILWNNRIIGHGGLIDSKVAQRFGIHVEIFGAELDYDILENIINRELKYTPIPKFPYIEKDVAFVIDKNHPVASVIDMIRTYGGRLLKEVTVFDVYEGDKIPEGKRSVAFRLRFQSLERTLKDSEVEQIFRKIIKRAQKEHDIPLRDQ